MCPRDDPISGKGNWTPTPLNLSRQYVIGAVLLGSLVTGCGLGRDLDILHKGYSSSVDGSDGQFSITLPAERVRALGGYEAKGVGEEIRKIVLSESLCNDDYVIVTRVSYKNWWEFHGRCKK